MNKPKYTAGAIIWATISACGFAAQGITIDLQYPSGTLFAPAYDATAKAAIEAAAADLSSAITTTLESIDTDVYIGTNGSTSVKLEWEYSYSDLGSQSEVVIPEATSSPDSITIHVGTALFTGLILGSGAPAKISADPFVVVSSMQLVDGAVANAASASEAAYRRGGGPRIDTYDGFVLGLATYSVDFGVAWGNIAFDIDSNNNGLPDTPAQLNNFWHWDHQTPVAAGKYDVYSVALHEMLHVLGIGVSAEWYSRISGGSNWTGPEVQAITGSGTNMVSGSHVADGITSYRISDGMPQEVVMAHDLYAGQRKTLTVLDLAFLRDIGWETITPVPPTTPADFNGDGLVNHLDLAVWQEAFGRSSAGDADGDEVTDGHDFLIWQRESRGASTLATNHMVPEPSGITLLVAWIYFASTSRRFVPAPR